MKFALAGGKRIEAQPQLSAECPSCGSPMVAKCGEFLSWHWAHKRRTVCDTWWENETEWHRVWKNHFPVECQEIIHTADDGQRHIADVETRDGWVIEFQHSPITPDERRSREAFYGGLIWVVDGSRRIRDAPQFLKAWSGGRTPFPLINKRRINAPAGALLREWVGSPAHVFFDFCDKRELWWVFPHSDSERAYVQPVARELFVRAMRDTGLRTFDDLVDNFRAFVAEFEQPPPTPQRRRPIQSSGSATQVPLLRRQFRF